MKYLKAFLLAVLAFVQGCQSGVVMHAGGYKMIHFNNPECMGSSAAGAMLVKDGTKGTDDEIVKANIGFKTGYCEAITGQVIAVGGEIAGKKILADGVKKSGNETKVNTKQETVGGGSGVVPLGNSTPSTGTAPDVDDLPL